MIKSKQYIWSPKVLVKATENQVHAAPTNTNQLLDLKCWEAMVMFTPTNFFFFFLNVQSDCLLKKKKKTPPQTWSFYHNQKFTINIFACRYSPEKTEWKERGCGWSLGHCDARDRALTHIHPGDLQTDDVPSFQNVARFTRQAVSTTQTS